MQVEIVNTKNIFLSNAKKSDITKFENGKVRKEYRQLLKEGKMTLEQLREVLDAKKNEAVQEVVTGAYKDKKYALQGEIRLTTRAMRSIMKVLSKMRRKMMDKNYLTEYVKAQNWDGSKILIRPIDGAKWAKWDQFNKKNGIHPTQEKFTEADYLPK